MHHVNGLSLNEKPIAESKVKADALFSASPKGVFGGNVPVAQMRGGRLISPAKINTLTVPERKAKSWADQVGIFLSFLCVIHCMLTPVVLLCFPAVQALTANRFHEGFHHVLLLILPIVALFAFYPGYRTHRRLDVFAWAVPGFILIASVALYFEESTYFSTAISVAGSLCLVRSHWLNRHFCACCESPSKRAKESRRGWIFASPAAEKHRLLRAPKKRLR